MEKNQNVGTKSVFTPKNFYFGNDKIRSLHHVAQPTEASQNIPPIHEIS